MGSRAARREERIAHVRAEVFDMQRAQLGTIGVVGDLVVAVGVPVVLWNDVSHPWLIAWGVGVGIFSFAWEVLLWLAPGEGRHNERLRDAWGWGSTVVWGLLPWIEPSALDDRGVVWIMVFVVVFAIGTDVLFMTQTAALSLDWMVVAYAGSFVVGFAVHGAIAAVVAVLVCGLSFVLGGAGWGAVADELIHKRVESDERSRIDELTGLGSRAAAVEAIEALVESRVESVTCAFVDIDDFKALNDNYGYEVGDLALCEVGRMLVDRLPERWTVARFGGDEFVAVGAGAIDLRQVVDAEVVLEGHGGLLVTQPLSIGVTTLPARSADADVLFREGAAALRTAKRLGKHQVVEMNDRLREAEAVTVRLASRAGAALENREIVAWAQPIVELATGRAVGMELLARWPQADGSMVMPDLFVPVIEDQGRGPELGMLMIEQAVEALCTQELRDRALYVTVNLSARHLFHRRLPVEVRALLRDHGVPARRLVLEVTESQHLPSSPVWRETARQLRELGVGLAIDDFGTGYSSMEQLLSMPFSHLKVDRLLTEAIERPGASDLAAAIAAMAHGAQMTTVVEGIETESQRAAMLAAGYQYGQGYLFAHPAPLADVVADLISRPTATGSGVV